MPQYVIERDMPGVGALGQADLKGASQTSCSVLRDLGPEIQWVRHGRQDLLHLSRAQRGHHPRARRARRVFRQTRSARSATSSIRRLRSDDRSSDGSALPAGSAGRACHSPVDCRRGQGNRKRKTRESESSAALAVNTFGWFVERPALLPSLPGLAHAGVPALVDVEYCARFPWSGGRHPWLDAVVESDTYFTGIESKRYEPYRDRKTVSLSSAYDRPVWGDRMRPFERARDRLRSSELRFEYLDAAQLVKHAFGLVTDARRRGRKPVLFYLYAEPERLGRVALRPSIFEAHRGEIARFAEEIRGAEVEFAAASYREWLAGWPASGPDVAGHARAVTAAFGL